VSSSGYGGRTASCCTSASASSSRCMRRRGRCRWGRLRLRRHDGMCCCRRSWSTCWPSICHSRGELGPRHDGVDTASEAYSRPGQTSDARNRRRTRLTVATLSSLGQGARRCAAPTSPAGSGSQPQGPCCSPMGCLSSRSTCGSATHAAESATSTAMCLPSPLRSGCWRVAGPVGTGAGEAAVSGLDRPGGNRRRRSGRRAKGSARYPEGRQRC
jgi:hypothetical protein